MHLRHTIRRLYRNKLERYLKKLRFELFKSISRKKFLFETEPCNPPELIQKIEGDYRYVEIEVNDKNCFEVFTRESVLPYTFQIIKQRRQDILDAIAVVGFILGMISFMRGLQLKKLFSFRFV